MLSQFMSNLVKYSIFMKNLMMSDKMPDVSKFYLRRIYLIDSPSQLLRQDGNLDAVLLAALTVKLTPNMQQVDSIDYNKLVEEIKFLDWKEATMTDSMWYTNTCIINEMLEDHSISLIIQVLVYHILVIRHGGFLPI